MYYNILSRIEKWCALQQGKGWGSYTIKEEIKSLGGLLLNPVLGIDIGANTGEYSEQLRGAFPHMEIHLFEPSKANAAALNTKFKNDEKTHIHMFAVSASNCTADLFSNSPGSGLSSLTKRRLDHFGLDFNTVENVETVKFEDFWVSQLASRNIDLLKIDVEGHELNVLNGLGAAIDHINVIQFEFGGCNIDSKTYFQDFWYFFKVHPFSIHRITPLGLQSLTRYSEQDETFMTTNFICVNKEFNSVK
jgi:FkbM family methyltransferase